VRHRSAHERHARVPAPPNDDLGATWSKRFRSRRPATTCACPSTDASRERAVINRK
jgi:hypothetical protein